MTRAMTTVVTLTTLAAAGCGPGGLFDRGAVVAEAAKAELSTEALASIVAGAEGLPVTRDIVERLAHRWVEYTLFASRIARGDSLLEPALVEQTMWPEIEQALVEGFHQQVLAQHVEFDESMVDSVYDAGAYRLIDHILVGVDAGAGAAARTAARRRAEQIRAQAAAGASWARLNEQSDDPGARRTGGSLGVIRRGHMAEEFEAVAFALAPGAISPVFESSYGFHIVRRRALGQAREEFTSGVRVALEEDFTVEFLDGLLADWDVTLEEDAPAAMRTAAGAPLRFLDSPRVVGRHREGAFTVADFVRWLQVLPLQQQGMVGSAGDEALERMARSMIRNEVLLLEAHGAGIEVDDAQMADVRRLYAADVARVRAALGLPATEGDGWSVDMAVLAYLEGIVRNLDDVVVVPAFLGVALRQEGTWAVSERGLDRVVARAQEARLAMTLERRAAPEDVPDGDR